MCLLTFYLNKDCGLHVFNLNKDCGLHVFNLNKDCGLHVINFSTFDLQVFDGDRDDQVTLDLKGPDARMFQITPKGEIHLVDLARLTGSEAHLVVTAQEHYTV